MKIALITEYDQIGGGEANLLGLAEALSAQCEVTLFCPAGPVLDAAVGREIPVRAIRRRPLKSWYSFIPIPAPEQGLLGELRKHSLVHAYSLNILPRLFGLGRIPIVWTVHGYWERPRGLRAKVIDRMVDHVIPVSGDVNKITDFPSSKKTVIPLGTRIPDAAPVAKPFDPATVTLVSVGRFQRIKGQDLLLAAARSLSTRMPETRFELLIVGDVNGDEAEDIQYRRELFLAAESARSGNLAISFEGRRSDVAAYYDMADFVVIPSRYESFSMVAIEALARGRPVIGPDVGGPREILTDRGAGALFRAGEADSLCQTLAAAINGRDAFRPDAGRATALRYSIARQAERHLELYRSLLP